jgi:TolB-like protein
MKLLDFKYLISFFSFIITLPAISQTDYDKAMFDIAEQVAQRINNKNRKNIAVWYFHNSFGKKDSLGDYVGRDFSVHFTNVNSNLNILDRDHLDQIVREQNLQEEGFIDPATAKRINMLTGADAIVTGTIDVSLHRLRLRIKIIDAESGAQLSALIGYIPIDDHIRYILHESGINKQKNINEQDTRLETNETYNSAETTDSECGENKTGDYCFDNKSSQSYMIRIFGQKKGPFYNLMKDKNVKNGQTACFYDLLEGVYSFQLISEKGFELRQGEFRIDRCRSLTYNID